MISDPQNMRLDNLIVELCALLAEIWRNIHFPVMASLICIKMVCGTFCQLFNIANRFLWYFSNLETSIRNWFPGGARYPLLPTRLIQWPMQTGMLDPIRISWQKIGNIDMSKWQCHDQNIGVAPIPMCRTLHCHIDTSRYVMDMGE